MTWAQGARCSPSAAPRMVGQNPDLGPRGWAATQHQHGSADGEDLWVLNPRECGATAPRAGLTAARALVSRALGCSFD